MMAQLVGVCIQISCVLQLSMPFRAAYTLHLRQLYASE